jgi:hypothetical protein
MPSLKLSPSSKFQNTHWNQCWAGLVQVPKLELLKIFCLGEKESGTGANWSHGLGYLELDQN